MFVNQVSIQKFHKCRPQTNSKKETRQSRTKLYCVCDGKWFWCLIKDNKNKSNEMSDEIDENKLDIKYYEMLVRQHHNNNNHNNNSIYRYNYNGVCK